MFQVKHISFQYSETKKGINNISFDVDPGEIICFVGETGSGKSTLIKCLAGFYDLKKGRIKIDTEIVTGPKDNLIPGHNWINYVAQDFNLLPNHTAFENITAELHQYFKYEKKKIALNLLKRFNIYELKNTIPRFLSGGQQQRIALAKALAERPRLLLLDEPFNQQDSWNKDDVLRAIKSLAKEENIAVIMVTHDYEDALYMSDKIGVMQSGKLIRMASPFEVYENPRNEYVAQLFGDYFIDSDEIIRPNRIFISRNQGQRKIKVLDKRFRGNRSEVLIELNNYFLWIVETIYTSIGDEIYISILDRT